MLANMQTFIAEQNGLIGERAAQQVSQEVVTGFITDKLADLSDNSQATLLTLLREAPRSMKAGSVTPAFLNLQRLNAAARWTLA